MYVDEIDFDALTVEKLIDLVFTEMVYRKIQELEEETLAKRDQTDGNQWTRFRESTEITLKNCLICHVLFGSRYILNLKELHLLTI